MFVWSLDFEARFRRLSPELQEEIAGLLQGLLEDPEIAYTKEEFAWTRRDDIGPKSVQIVVKNASGPNATVVVAFESGDVAGIFVKGGDVLTARDIDAARKNYGETLASIGAKATTWNRRIE